MGLIKPESFDQAIEALQHQATAEFGSIILSKLFVSEAAHTKGPYLNRTLEQIEDFISFRVERYPAEKYADRMFFSSPTFQLLISQIQRAIKKREAA